MSRLDDWSGLRGRLLLLVCGGWVVFSLMLWVITTGLVDIGFSQIETRESRQVHQRMMGIVDARLQAIDMKAHDWGEWNDMDDWLRLGDTNFVRENIDDSIIAILRERDHGFFRRDRSIAGLYSFDRRTRVPIPIDTACIIQVVDELDGDARGIYRCGDSLEMFAARPVRHSQKEGTSGWVVFGHRIDREELEELSALLGQRVLVAIVDSSTPPEPWTDSTARIYFNLPIHGDGKVARIEILQPRAVHLIALKVRQYLLIASLFLLVGGSVVSILVLDFLVVRRILGLSAEVVGFETGNVSKSHLFGDGVKDEIGALGAAIDELVSRLVGVQDRLEKSLDAAQAGIQAKGSFLASMSHDLRTPLNGMIGLTDFLAKTRLDPSQREAIELLRGGSENLLTMINDILDFSRSEAGYVEALPEDIATETLFHQPVRILAPMAHRQGVAITVVFDPDLPSRLVVDVERLRQVLQNLVGNAVKFTEEGEVLLHVRRVAQTGCKHRIRVSVLDTGPGIPSELLGTIFDPFVQVSKETSKRRGGSGLGLAIAHRIVERMGGSLMVASEIGKGSEFFFEIEVSSPPGAGRIVPLKFPWTGGDPVAVLVRRASLRSNILEILVRLGVECVELLLPESAFTFPGAQRVSLIIADIESLGEDGTPGIPTIRSCPGFANAPIVLLSRTDLLDDDNIRRTEGVQTILRLPVPPSQIIEAVETALHPRADVIAVVQNAFLRTMLSGMLGNRGHRLRFVAADGGRDSVPGPAPDILLLDGDSPSLDQDLETVRRTHPDILVVQLGGGIAVPDSERIERPFTAEQICEIVERLVHHRKVGKG